MRPQIQQCFLRL